MQFRKYEGLGNDFIVVDTRAWSAEARDLVSPERARALCDRHFGIGADGVLRLDPASDADARMEYFYETLRKVDERVGGKDFGAGPVHGEPGRHLAAFMAALADDFNYASGMADVSALFTELNELADKPPVKDKALVGRTLQALREDVRKVASVLGLFEDPPAAWLLRRRDRAVREKGIDVAKVEGLLEARRAARAAKDYAASDRLRDELKALGVEIMDTAAGTGWKVA